MRKINYMTIVVLWLLQGICAASGQGKSGVVRMTNVNQWQKLGAVATSHETDSVTAGSQSGKKVTFGIRSGLNWSWLYSKRHTIMERNYPIGYSVGLAAEISLCPQLGIASGINFSLERQNYAIDTSSEDDLGIWYRQTSQSFDIPLGLKLYPLATQCVSLNTGLQFHAIIKAKQNIKDIDAGERVTKRNKTQYGRQAGNRINFYCAVGARILRQPMPVSLELQYLFGLTDYKQDSFLHNYTIHAITFFVSWQLK